MQKLSTIDPELKQIREKTKALKADLDRVFKVIGDSNAKIQDVKEQSQA